MIHQSIRLVRPFANLLGKLARPLANRAGLIHFQIPIRGHRPGIPENARQRREIEPGNGHLPHATRANGVRADAMVGRGDLSDMTEGQGWCSDDLGRCPMDAEDGVPMGFGDKRLQW
jgi:hypothetical protein